MVYNPKEIWVSLFFTNFFFYFVTFVNLSSPRVIKQLLNRRHAYWNLGRGMRDRLASDPVSVESYKGAPLRLASTFDNAPPFHTSRDHLKGRERCMTWSCFSGRGLSMNGQVSHANTGAGIDSLVTR